MRNVVKFKLTPLLDCYRENRVSVMATNKNSLLQFLFIFKPIYILGRILGTSNCAIWNFIKLSCHILYQFEITWKFCFRNWSKIVIYIWKWNLFETRKKILTDEIFEKNLDDQTYDAVLIDRSIKIITLIIRNDN